MAGSASSRVSAQMNRRTMGRVIGVRVASRPSDLRWESVRSVERMARSAMSLAVDLAGMCGLGWLGDQSGVGRGGP